METILVLGVRGKTGRHVAAALEHQPSIRVRGAGRNLKSTSLPHVQAVHFEWEDQTSWPSALNGVSAIFLVKPKTSAPASTVKSFLKLAGEVKKVVLLSEIGCETRDDSTDERKVEKTVEAMSSAWTILRPNWFMQNFSEPKFYLEAIRDFGELEVPTNGQPLSFVDTRDIADVAVAALTGSRHARCAYTLTGPQALTFAEVAEKTGDIAGHKVRHLDSPMVSFLSRHAAGGTGKSQIEYYRRIYTLIQNGLCATISTSVQQVTGHPPRTFSAFVEENRDTWCRTVPAP